MKWTGKIVGFLIGFLLGSPITIILGCFIGHLVDIGTFTPLFSHSQQNASIRNIFFNSSFMIMGHIAKSDGHVSGNEIRAAEKVMDQMHLSPRLKQEAIRLFNVGKQPDFNLDQTIEALRAACGDRPSLLAIFIDFQTKIVFADSRIPSHAKREKLIYICNQLHLNAYTQGFDREELNGQSHSQSQQGYQKPYRPDALKEAYTLLGVTPQNSDAEIKKAYRRLMSQNHPDKLIAKGLPPAMIKLATQKTQEIKQAYERICATRTSLQQ